MHQDPHEEYKISQDELSHEMKIAMNFNVANSVRWENKVLTLKTHYMLYQRLNLIKGSDHFIKEDMY